MARLVIPYERETRPATLEKDERKLATPERKFVRRICGRIIDNATQRHEVRSNED